MNKFKRHLSVANVLSCIALFVALSATAVAATKLKTGQVKAVNIANEAVTAAKLKKLFEKKVLQVAVVARYQFPAPVRTEPKTDRDWFEKRFQVVTAETAATLPGPGAE